MLKALIVIAQGKISEEMEFKLFMKRFEQEEWHVHIFEDEDINNFSVESLPNIIEYINKNYKRYDSITVMSNIESLLFLWYSKALSEIDDYIFYMGNYKKPRTQVENCDFRFDKPIKPLKIVYNEIDDIIPLILNYGIYVISFEDIDYCIDINKINDIGYLLQSKLYEKYILSVMKKYNIPVHIIIISTIQFFYNQGNNLLAQDIINSVYDDYKKLDLEKKVNSIKYFESLIKSLKIQAKVGVLSFLVQVSNDKKYYNELIRVGLLDSLNIMDKASIFWLLKRLVFVGNINLDYEDELILRKFYCSCVDEIVNSNILKLPKYKTIETRNKNCVVVITSQLLGMLHAPTRNVFDYSVNLAKLGKEVIIINSADCIKENSLPLFNGFYASYAQEYNNYSCIEMEGYKFKFYQSRNNMPNYEDIQNIIDIVDKANPEFMVCVGDSVLTADVCQKFTDVIRITCGAGLPIYPEGFWALARKPLEKDKYVCDYFSMPIENVLPIHYSFLKKVKSKNFQRKDFGVPEDFFVICIIGNRLDDEVNEEVLNELEYILEIIPKAYILFAGTFNEYDLAVKDYIALKQRSKYIGFCNDIQSIYAICNVYYNPLRSGGATSAAEAMLEGLPIITRPHGDVYYQLWMDRSFSNSDEIVSFIQKCISDDEFYLKEKSKAFNHVEIFFDTSKMMREILAYMENKLSE